jgi:hypothetical protein
VIATADTTAAETTRHACEIKGDMGSSLGKEKDREIGREYSTANL